MNTDWLDEFDDSVLNDTIEANDSSTLTGFENNTEAETETTSPLEAESVATGTSEDVTQSSDDFFKYFTPTISRAAGPSSMNNNASSKGDGPAKGPSSSPKGDDGDTDVDLNDYYGGGKTDGDDPNDQGGYGSNWDNDNDPDTDPDVDLDDYYGGGKTDGDNDDDDDYGSWTDSDRLEAAKEVAESLGKEAEKLATESKLAEQAEEKAYKDAMLKAEVVHKAQVECDKIQSQIDAATRGINSGDGVGTEESKKAHEAMAIAAAKYGKDSKEYKKAVTEAIEIDKKELERLQASLQTAEAKLDAANDEVDLALEAYDEASKASWKAKVAAKEALTKAQAAKDKAGTLAGEAKEAFERAQEKQKEWEQKQKEQEQKDAEAAKKAGIDGKSESGSNTSTNTNSATNNPVTFDLSKTLADAGAKMTEKEYGQVADFVAEHPEMASIINGGLTNAEKASVANVIAGIQAINAGNYLTAAKEFAQGLGMTLVSAVQLIASGIYGAGARILGIIKSFMENPNIKYGSHNKDFETFEKMRAEYGDSSELQALYDTAKGTTDQKQTFDYMKDNAATNVGEYNEGLVEDVNKVVSDASRKVIHYSPYVLEAVKKWRE